MVCGLVNSTRHLTNITQMGYVRGAKWEAAQIRLLYAYTGAYNLQLHIRRSI